MKRSMDRVQKSLIIVISLLLVFIMGLLIYAIWFKPRHDSSMVESSSALTNTLSINVHRSLMHPPQKPESRFAPLPAIFEGNAYNEQQLDRLYALCDPSLQGYYIVIQFSIDNGRYFFDTSVFVQGEYKDPWLVDPTIINVGFPQYINNENHLYFDGSITPYLDENDMLCIKINGTLYQSASGPLDTFEINDGSFSQLTRYYQQKDDAFIDFDQLIEIDPYSFDSTNTLILE